MKKIVTIIVPTFLLLLCYSCGSFQKKKFMESLHAKLITVDSSYTDHQEKKRVFINGRCLCYSDDLFMIILFRPDSGRYRVDALHPVFKAYYVSDTIGNNMISYTLSAMNKAVGSDSEDGDLCYLTNVSYNDEEITDTICSYITQFGAHVPMFTWDILNYLEKNAEETTPDFEVFEKEMGIRF